MLSVEFVHANSRGDQRRPRDEVPSTILSPTQHEKEGRGDGSQAVKEVEALAKERDDLAEQLSGMKDALIRNMAAAILKEIKPTYELSPIDLHFACSPAFYEEFTDGWDSYEPLRRSQSYTEYRICTCCERFQRNFPGWDLSREHSVGLSERVRYRLVATQQHPIFAIYSPQFANMRISFTYQPDPLPPYFVPRRRRGSSKRKLEELYGMKHHPSDVLNANFPGCPDGPLSVRDDVPSPIQPHKH